MDRIAKLVEEFKRNPKNVRFADVKKVCDHFFGESRVSGSHHFYPMTWPGLPLVNIQNVGGKAKEYQVRQVLEAIAKKEADQHDR